MYEFMEEKIVREDSIKKVLFDAIIDSSSSSLVRDVPLYQDVYHLLGTVRCVSLLAAKRNMDKETAVTAMLLHDISRLKDGSNVNHALKSSAMAEQILKNNGNFTKEEINLITSAIRKHVEKDKIDTDFDELIKDADLLDGYLNDEKSVSSNLKGRLNKILTEVGL